MWAWGWFVLVVFLAWRISLCGQKSAKLTAVLDEQKRDIDGLKEELLDAEKRLERHKDTTQHLIAENKKIHESRELDLQKTILHLNEKIETLKSTNQRLIRYAGLANAEEEEAKVRTQTTKTIAEANKTAKQKIQKAQGYLDDATKQAAQLIRNANLNIEQTNKIVAKVATELTYYQSQLTAIKNQINGYNDQTVFGQTSHIDDLAEAYSFDEAGRELKVIRQVIQSMQRNNTAGECKYVELDRRQAAIAFAVDSFNGKVDAILSRLKTTNLAILAKQIEDAAAIVNQHGWPFREAKISPLYVEARISELKWLHQIYQLKELQREEQRRIREQIREEERVKREIERELKDAAKQEEMLHKAMQKAQELIKQANEEQKAKYQAELDALQLKLTEAEQRGQRAMSMAQQTKAGHVYIISNIGSFGPDVHKVGMTRRLDPLDRVRELGDASVPFPFDVHAMIWSTDAPALETHLHKKFVQAQVNKVNPRKEFFRLSLADLKTEIEGLGLKTEWTIAATAAQYYETKAIEAEIAGDIGALAAWKASQEAFERELQTESAEEGDN